MPPGAAGDDGDLLALIAHGVPVGAVAGGYMIAGSLGCGDSGVVSTVIQGASGSASRIACIWAAPRAWYRPSARPSGRVHSRSRCPWPARSCAACASRALVSSTVWPAVPGGTARVKVTRNSAAVTALLVGVGGRVVRVRRERGDLIGTPHPQRHRGEDLLEPVVVCGGE